MTIELVTILSVVSLPLMKMRFKKTTVINVLDLKSEATIIKTMTIPKCNHE